MSDLSIQVIFPCFVVRRGRFFPDMFGCIVKKVYLCSITTSDLKKVNVKPIK